MTEQSNNFLSNIHDNEYEVPFLKKIITYREMIYDRYRERESLNGWWNFGIDQYENCIRSKWYEEKYYDENGRELPVDYSFDQWEKIFVPSCWNMVNEKYFLYEGSAVYTRKFHYENHGEKRVFIKFGAVNYEAKIFLNKIFIGMHKGGSTPFFIDVTDYLEKENRIIVVANNSRKRTNVPADNTDWFNYGGIYRDVDLIRLPGTFVKDFSVSLVPGSGFSEINVEFFIEGNDRNGEALFEIKGLSVKELIPAVNGKGKAVIKASPELWSLGNPHLYDVCLSYRDDSVRDRVGFREIRVNGNKILLNGYPVFLKGISVHEESLQNGKAITVDEIIENIKIARDLKCNFIRLAHYPHTENTAFIADEMGIMLWEEIPVYWAIDFRNSGTYCDAENQLMELISRDINRASVIIWSVGNENPDTDNRFNFMISLVQKAREIDPSRLISAACLVDNINLVIADRLAGYLDIIGLNEYYGWYDPDFDKLLKIFENSRPAKPVIVSEFGADARAGSRGSSKELGSEDFQKVVYEKQLDVISKISYVRGISPWILYDFRCPRRLHVMQNYYNIKGLLSADKKNKKLAYSVFQQFYKNW